MVRNIKKLFVFLLFVLCVINCDEPIDTDPGDDQIQDDIHYKVGAYQIDDKSIFLFEKEGTEKLLLKEDYILFMNEDDPVIVVYLDEDGYPDKIIADNGNLISIFGNWENGTVDAALIHEESDIEIKSYISIDTDLQTTLDISIAALNQNKLSREKDSYDKARLLVAYYGYVFDLANALSNSSQMGLSVFETYLGSTICSESRKVNGIDYASPYEVIRIMLTFAINTFEEIDMILASIETDSGTISTAYTYLDDLISGLLYNNAMGRNYFDELEGVPAQFSISGLGVYCLGPNSATPLKAVRGVHYTYTVTLFKNAYFSYTAFNADSSLTRTQYFLNPNWWIDAHWWCVTNYSDVGDGTPYLW